MCFWPAALVAAILPSEHALSGKAGHLDWIA